MQDWLLAVIPDWHERVGLSGAVHARLAKACHVAQLDSVSMGIRPIVGSNETICKHSVGST